MNPACTSIPVVIVDLDDEPAFAELVSLFLQRDRPAPEAIGSINELAEWIRENDPNRLPINFCLPEVAGCKTFAAITAYSDEPRVFLAGSIRDIEHLLGVDVGEACDRRPANTASLKSRLLAIGERASQSRKRRASYAGVDLDNDSLTASVGGIDLNLTHTEFELMRLFVNNPAKVFTRDQLLTVTSGDRADTSDRSVDAHIKNLRRKLRNSEGHSAAIRAVYGVGYQLD